jgi:hypothetical protein
MRQSFTCSIALLFIAAALAPAHGQGLSPSAARAIKNQKRASTVKNISKPSGVQAPKRSTLSARTPLSSQGKSNLSPKGRNAIPQISPPSSSKVRPEKKRPLATPPTRQTPAFPSKPSGQPKVSGKLNGSTPNISQPRLKPALPGPKLGSNSPNLNGRNFGPPTKRPDISGKLSKPGSQSLNLNGAMPQGKIQPLPRPNLDPKLAKAGKFDELFKSVNQVDLPKISPEVLKKDLPKLNLVNPIQPIPQAKMQKAHLMMANHFHGHAHCDWWVNVLCGWYSNHYGCHWTHVCLTPGYWDCWTPCHYRVIYCHSRHTHVRMAWYLGLECMLIPDLHALGVQEVSPMSPAYFAGLEPGDMILSVNGYGFDSENTLTDVIRDSDGFITLEVFREGLDAPITMDIQLRRMMVVRY